MQYRLVYVSSSLVQTHLNSDVVEDEVKGKNFCNTIVRAGKVI